MPSKAKEIIEKRGCTAQQFILRELHEHGPMRLFTGYKETRGGEIISTEEKVILTSVVSLVGLDNQKYTTFTTDRPCPGAHHNGGNIHTITEKGITITEKGITITEKGIKAIKFNCVKPQPGGAGER